MDNTYFNSFIKNNFLILVGHILIYAQGIIMVPIIIKTAGATVYGEYILVFMTIGLIFGISSFGVGFRCRRFLPSTVDIKSRRELFYPQMLFQMGSITLLSLVLIFLSPLIEKMLIKKEIEFLIWLVVLYLFLYLLYSQTTDYFRYTERINYFNYATVSLPYVNIIIVLLIYYFFHRLNINLLVSAHLFSVGLITIPLIFKIGNEIGFKLLIPKIRNLIEDIKLGFPLLLGYVMDSILSGSDRYVIAFLMSVTAVGYYSPAYALGSLIVFFPKVSGVVLPPLLSKAVDNERKEEAQVMVNYTIKGFLLIAIPFIIGSCILSKQLLILFTNAEVAKNAYLVTPIVAFGTLFYGLNVILSNVLFVQMKTAVMFKASVIAAIVNLTLNFVLLYFFRNIIIAALTTLLSYFIVFIYVYKIVRKDWLVQFQPAVIVKSMTASLFMVTLLFWVSFKAVEVNSGAILVGKLVLGIIVYIGGLFALRTFSKKELQFMKNCVCR